ncbi:MAG: hypothetical protein J6U99_00835 [Rikenellaceae bacterium]|nr:hypothetical protein [Rikenellaceae bacterium]
MKKLLLLLIPLFGMLTVESNAQAVFNSTCRLPITKGDSVLIATGWDDYGSQSLGVTGIEYKGLYTPDETEKAKKRFAFVVYPEATRIIDPTVYKKGREESLYETFKKFKGEIQFMVVVVDKDGNEVRDSLSNVPNAPCRIKRVEITNDEPLPQTAVAMSIALKVDKNLKPEDKKGIKNIPTIESLFKKEEKK